MVKERHATIRSPTNLVLATKVKADARSDYTFSWQARSMGGPCSHSTGIDGTIRFNSISSWVSDLGKPQEGLWRDHLEFFENGGA